MSAPLLPTILGLAAAGLHVFTYGLYFRALRRGHARPNPATWLIWTVLGLIGVSTFQKASHDFATGLQFIAGVGGCASVFLYAMRAGKRTPFGWVEWAGIATIPCAFYAWGLKDGHVLANVLINVVSAIAFVPMWRRLWRNPSLEQPVLWGLWSFAYAITLANVLLHHEPGLVLLLGPIMGVVGQGVTALLALRSRGRGAIAGAAAEAVA